ncbi:MAG: hypothetical protein IJS19_06390 [Muribaculaceae bacterium]|nr:hypothetical protein [Muribaculaceae bacterium]
MMKTLLVFVLTIAAFILICGEVTDNSIATFLWVKAAGFACAYTAYRIGRRDGRLRKHIERLTRLTDET